MDNLRSIHQRRGSLVPPLMPQTLWSAESSSRDARMNEDKGVNVQVILRCRPPTELEVKQKLPLVISCNEIKQEVTAATQNAANKLLNRTYLFDKVFGPASQQKNLYDHVVAPIVNEALEGYNCTIFAYGQTGTGKTYTMEGEGGKDKNGKLHKDAGVIPRAVQQIFDILESQNAEYSIKVSYLELYNEEITDLLAPDEGSKFSDEKPKKSIALMEDGKGAVFIRGLEEEIVCTAGEIYKILENGSAKKHTAETLLNKQSNRSHSIFSITIQIKECTSEGLELIKSGKLNLVDLAGSENILRSGVREERAREAGEINKSLLTLGRVINSLVEHSVHVPYRDSKLTRLLRDSLGGKTKTCIIATVSPSINCLEETLNTLDYACRAKNIMNWPEVNQKVVKSVLLKELYTEINHLKQELRRTKDKNGIYIPREHYLIEEAAKKAMAEKVRCMEHDLELNQKQLMEVQLLYIYQQQLTADLNEKLERKQRELEKTELAQLNLEDQLSEAKELIKQKEYLISNLLGSERAITERALELRAELQNATSEISSLFAQIEQRNHMEDKNKLLLHSMHTQLVNQLEVLTSSVAAAMMQQEEQLKVVQENTQSFLSAKAEAVNEYQTQLQNLKCIYVSGLEKLDDSAEELYGNSQLAFGNLSSEVSSHSSAIAEFVSQVYSKAESTLKSLETNLNNLELRIALHLQLEQENQSRMFRTAEYISEVLWIFFKNISSYIWKLTLMEEESQKIYNKQLRALAKKLKDLDAREETELLEKVAEVLASSHAEKKRLVQTTLSDFQEHTSRRNSQLKKETSDMLDFNISTQKEWVNYTRTAEEAYIQNSTLTEIWKGSLGESSECCTKNWRMVAEQWETVKKSFPSIQKRNVDSCNSIIKRGLKANEEIRAQHSSVASKVLEQRDASERDLLAHVEYLQQLGYNTCGRTNSFIGTCCENMKEMQSMHRQRVIEIVENARKSLIDDFQVDEPSSSAPRKQRFSLPTKESIENLRSPSIDELLKPFECVGLSKQKTGDANGTECEITH